MSAVVSFSGRPSSYHHLIVVVSPRRGVSVGRCVVSGLRRRQRPSLCCSSSRHSSSSSSSSSPSSSSASSSPPRSSWPFDAVLGNFSAQSHGTAQKAPSLSSFRLPCCHLTPCFADFFQSHGSAQVSHFCRHPDFLVAIWRRGDAVE